MFGANSWVGVCVGVVCGVIGALYIRGHVEFFFGPTHHMLHQQQAHTYMHGPPPQPPSIAQQQTTHFGQRPSGSRGSSQQPQAPPPPIRERMFDGIHHTPNFPSAAAPHDRRTLGGFSRRGETILPPYLRRQLPCFGGQLCQREEETAVARPLFHTTASSRDDDEKAGVDTIEHVPKRWVEELQLRDLPGSLVTMSAFGSWGPPPVGEDGLLDHSQDAIFYGGAVAEPTSLCPPLFPKCIETNLQRRRDASHAATKPLREAGDHGAQTCVGAFLGTPAPARGIPPESGVAFDQALKSGLAAVSHQGTPFYGGARGDDGSDPLIFAYNPDCTAEHRRVFVTVVYPHHLDLLPELRVMAETYGLETSFLVVASDARVATAACEAGLRADSIVLAPRSLHGLDSVQDAREYVLLVKYHAMKALALAACEVWYLEPDAWVLRHPSDALHPHVTHDRDHRHHPQQDPNFQDHFARGKKGARDFLFVDLDVIAPAFERATRQGTYGGVLWVRGGFKSQGLHFLVRMINRIAYIGAAERKDVKRRTAAPALAQLPGPAWIGGSDAFFEAAELDDSLLLCTLFAHRPNYAPDGSASASHARHQLEGFEVFNKKVCDPVRKLYGKEAVSEDTSKKLTWSTFSHAVVQVDEYSPMVYPGTALVRVPERDRAASKPSRAAPKELGVFTGADGYYSLTGRQHVAHAQDRSNKFIAFDFSIATNARMVYHNPMNLFAHLLELVGLAVATDRILVLPEIFHFQRVSHFWELFDVGLLNRYVSWRPASFWQRMHSPDDHASRVRLADVRAAQLVVYPGRIGVREIRNVSADHNGAQAADWYNTGNSRQKEWAVARNDATARRSDILFVFIARKKGNWKGLSCLQAKGAPCFTRLTDQSQIGIEALLWDVLHHCAGPDLGAGQNIEAPREGTFINPLQQCRWSRRHEDNTRLLSLVRGPRMVAPPGASALARVSKQAAGSLSWLDSVNHPCFLSFLQEALRGADRERQGSSSSGPSSRESATVPFAERAAGLLWGVRHGPGAVAAIQFRAGQTAWVREPMQQAASVAGSVHAILKALEGRLATAGLNVGMGSVESQVVALRGLCQLRG